MNKELLQERKKMIYDFICDELYVPMKAKEMAIVLNVPKSQRGELVEVLDALVADGKVEISGRGKYVKSEGKYLTGVFTAHPRGFGFVTVEGEGEDIFIPGTQTNGALHMDTVQITLSKNSSGKRKEGTVDFLPDQLATIHITFLDTSTAETLYELSASCYQPISLSTTGGMQYE